MFRILLFIFLSSSIIGFSQKDAPYWVNNWGKSLKHPSSAYLTGMSFVKANSVDDESAFELAFDNAKANLSEKLLQKVESETNLIQEEINDGYVEQISAQISTKTKVDITGLEYEAPYFDKKSYKLYVLVYAKISKMQLLYTDKWEKINYKIKSEFENGEFFEYKNKKSKALEHFYRCQTFIGERDEYSTILTCLGKKIELKKDDVQTSKIQKKINELNNVKIESIDDLLFDVLQSFQRQMKEPAKGVTIGNPLLAQLKVPTDLSRFLKTKLEIACTNQLKWQITNFSEWKKVKEITPEIIEKFRYTIHSNYKIQGNNIVFRADIFDMVTEKNVCTYYSMFSKTVFDKSKMAYEPINFSKKISEQLIFSKNEPEPSALILKINTNKGSKNPVFYQGEEIKLSYKVNSKSYIRIIYHRADGSRALIMDNFYVSKENVGKMLKCPFKFISAAPFGIEVMQINASTEKFNTLNTKLDEAGNVIISDPLEQVLQKTRVSDNSKIVSAEQRIIINTMKK